MSSRGKERVRNRKTRASVFVADRLARILITGGGIATIVAICAVAVFLVAVSLPLFLSPTLTADEPRTVETSSPPWFVIADQDLRLAAVIDQAGTCRLFELSTGKLLSVSAFPGDVKPTAFAASKGSDQIAVGLADGKIRLGSIQFKDTFPTDDESTSSLKVGEYRATDNGIVVRIDDEQIRQTVLAVKWNDPVATSRTNPIIRMDLAQSASGSLVATAEDSGEVFLHRVSKKKDLLSGKEVVKLSSASVDQDGAQPWGREIASLSFLGNASQLLVIPKTGSIFRFDTHQPATPTFVAKEEAGRATPISSTSMMLGRNTVLLGHESGEVDGEFLIREEKSAQHTSEQSLVLAKRLHPADGSPAVSLTSSNRSRLAAALFETGTISVYEVTTGDELVSSKLRIPTANATMGFAPRDDGIVVATPTAIEHLRLRAEHPEATLEALFTPIWYEGYQGPEYVWQSDTSGGAEPKFGMMPLIFGTLKATVYSMLFGVPLAILAAIYTSEFLHPRVKARIKPTIELMAGLPSVVLGFIGAMVLAPWVAGNLPQVLASFVSIPVLFMLTGHLWQLLPTSFTLRAQKYRFLIALVVLPIAVWLGFVIGPILENILLEGDIMLWLDGQAGSGLSGWIFILLPIAVVLTIWIENSAIDPWLRPRMSAMTRGKAAWVALIRFVAALAMVVLFAWIGALILDGVGWDPRGNVVGTYVQRNSLIVGFVMGFAIIPIIYTLADDALSTVPEHLRSASLGAGATPWQTTTWIVVPTAMSGLFSAVIVGLGRAVGETMIVLMAAGSTPIMEWNIFNGFRTLSANIAIELPEAAQGTTHYRTLFFAAVVLLIFTSILNTVAELVRIRFRRRAFQL